MATPNTASVLADDRITAFGMVIEATRRLERTFERSLRERHDLSLVAFEALLRLGRSREQQMSMTELADQMVLTSGGVTRLVDRLASAGQVERLQCASDRRVQWAKLTPHGRDVIEAATATHLSDLEAHFVAEMSSEEMATVSRVFDRLRTDHPD
ncbi:MAG TPA: MarR family transcriptional regulator [Acidimicrobiia bacterium]|jgi:DNA-binding MarR family transcriptional regulator|nr:MarR family transcriptional regulator [Acidimicrobiia bacterium]